MKNINVRFLLDVNVLIALAFPSHTLHQRAHAWFRRDSGRLWATCPLTQAGFLRIASRLLGGSPGEIAHRHHGQLATFDSGFKDLASSTGYANSLLLM